MTFREDCLAGRLILVTGASSGLGKAAAALFARCGARLALAGRDEVRLAGTLSSLGPGDHSTHVMDLDAADGAAEAVQSISKARGALDGIFYSAGSTMVLPVKLLKDRHLDEVWGAGLRGAFGVVRAAAKKGVMNDGGSIAIMSSSAAIRGRPALSSYCAAKAAVDALARATSLELADRRIRVNSIRAGAVETQMHHEYLASIHPAAAKDYSDRHPLGFGQPEDVANAALFLLSDASRWITGSNLAVDGGAAVK